MFATSVELVVPLWLWIAMGVVVYLAAGTAVARMGYLEALAVFGTKEKVLQGNGTAILTFFFFVWPVPLFIALIEAMYFLLARPVIWIITRPPRK